MENLVVAFRGNGSMVFLTRGKIIAWSEGRTAWLRRTSTRRAARKAAMP
jgi:hypothetical protein